MTQMLQVMQMNQLQTHQHVTRQDMTEALPRSMVQIPTTPAQAEASPVRSRSRSRSPQSSRGACTPEVGTPEALLPSSPAPVSGDGDPPTPEILRRLLAIANQDEPNMTKVQAVERLGDLAKQAKDRLAEQQSHTTVNHAQLLGGARALGGPHFQPDDVQKAREAISALNHDIAQACKGRSGSAQASLQLDVKFLEPIPSAADLAARIRGLLGAKGPLVNVQPLEECSWRKPTSHSWFAEKKGDARKCVFRVNIPPDSSHKKARHLSFQVSVGGRELTVKGNKGVLQQFGSNIILMFGPHRVVEASKLTKEVNTCLDDFWGAR